FFPNGGSTAELSGDVYGTFLGGDEDYVRTTATLAWFHRLGISKTSLMLRSRFGLLHGTQGHKAPKNELWKLGGNRFLGVRGYEDWEIVPIGNPAFLGGQAMTIFT